MRVRVLGTFWTYTGICSLSQCMWEEWSLRMCVSRPYQCAQVVWVGDPRAALPPPPEVPAPWQCPAPQPCTGQMLPSGLSGRAAHHGHAVPAALPPSAQGHASQASQGLLHQPGAVDPSPGRCTEPSCVPVPCRKGSAIALRVEKKASPTPACLIHTPLLQNSSPPEQLWGWASNALG